MDASASDSRHELSASINSNSYDDECNNCKEIFVKSIDKRTLYLVSWVGVSNALIYDKIKAFLNKVRCGRDK